VASSHHAAALPRISSGGGAQVPPPRFGDGEAALQRIMIIGGSGSGKSTLARQIGARTGLPVVHIDPMYWAPGWTPRPRGETKTMALAAASGEAWVFEGNHSETMDARAERADLIIFLDISRWQRLIGVIWRSLRHYGQVRPDMSPGCPEQIDLGFLRDFVWGYDRGGRPRALAFLQRWRGRREIVQLTSRAEMHAFLHGEVMSRCGKAAGE
jgi:adenylate kinase family enzyme